MGAGWQPKLRKCPGAHTVILARDGSLLRSALHLRDHMPRIHTSRGGDQVRSLPSRMVVVGGLINRLSPRQLRLSVRPERVRRIAEGARKNGASSISGMTIVGNCSFCDRINLHAN